MIAPLERLFFLIAAYCQIGTNTRAFILFFADTSNWVFRETRSHSLWEYLRVRCSQKAFETTAERLVGKLYESRRVELALRCASVERLASLTPAELPPYFREVEERFLRGYRETLPPELGEHFVAEQFLRMRSLWLRDLALRVVPTMFVVAALAFAGASLFTMSGGTAESLRNSFGHIRLLFGAAP